MAISLFLFISPPTTLSSGTLFKPNISGVISYFIISPSLISHTLVVPAIDISSTEPSPCTTIPLVTPRLRSTLASGSINFSSYTPITSSWAKAGFASGPNILNTVRIPNSFLVFATYFMALW